MTCRPALRCGGWSIRCFALDQAAFPVITTADWSPMTGATARCRRSVGRETRIACRRKTKRVVDYSMYVGTRRALIDHTAGAIALGAPTVGDC